MLFIIDHVKHRLDTSKYTSYQSSSVCVGGGVQTAGRISYLLRGEPLLSSPWLLCEI